MLCPSRACPLPLSRTSDTHAARLDQTEPFVALVAQWQPVFAGTACEILRAMNQIGDVLVTDSADAVVELARSRRPGIIIMGERLRGGSGARLIPLLRRHARKTAILMLTSHECCPYVRYALEAGTSGFLCKSHADAAQIEQAVRGVLAGEVWIGRKAAAMLAESVTRSQRAARQPLTARERQVWDLLSTGLSNAQIASALGISTSSVKNHVSGILRKLGAANRVHAALHHASHSEYEPEL